MSEHSFASLLRERALLRPDAVAYRFVADDESAEEITYGELDERARAVAAAVLAADRGRTGPALLLFAPGLDYLAGLFGCFYAGVPAVPAFPPDASRLSRTLPRLAAIIEDAGADVVLTTSDLAALMADWLATAVDGHVPQVITTDAPAEDGGPVPAVRPDGLALLQYTSGSTALPRGVMLSHTRLLANCQEIARAFGMHPGSSGGLWLPPYHDMGLIGGILAPLAAGIPVTLMSPVTFLRRPTAWLRMVSRYGATITGAPNFAYDLCVRRATDAEVAELDLSGVEVAFTGAEQVRAETMERFAGRFRQSGFRPASFYPCYGLAEATLFVTGGKPLDGWRTVEVARDALASAAAAVPAEPSQSSRSLVGCGYPGPGTRLLIADPATREPLPDGAVGEIWVDSPGVADGYWRRPEESARTFGASATTGDGPYLRTGDLGFLRDGELFVTGRLKDLIVVNGRNLDPVDVERVCEASVPGIRRNCGAAFAVDGPDGGTERLVVVYETGTGDEEGHRAAVDGIRRAVTREFGIPPYAVVLIAPRTIPKTSSGKVQRRLTRRICLAGGLQELFRDERAPSPATGPHDRIDERAAR
ncbi:fatty acyl-AMP ligase [Streptomyces sp. WZ.A104]|uniref:fatty acyl-AMP ligase n=1 Tax=unclassified Streptomyces TaxID=2593676 RepID=UPI00359C5C2B